MAAWHVWQLLRVVGRGDGGGGWGEGSAKKKGAVSRPCKKRGNLGCLLVRFALSFVFSDVDGNVYVICKSLRIRT